MGERHASISAVTVRREWSTASALSEPPVMHEVALDGEGGGGSPGIGLKSGSEDRTAQCSRAFEHQRADGLQDMRNRIRFLSEQPCDSCHVE